MPSRKNTQSREHSWMGRREEKDLTRMSGMQGLRLLGAGEPAGSLPASQFSTHLVTWRERDSVNAQRKQGQVVTEPNPKCHTQTATVKVAYSVPGTIPGAVPGTIPTAGHSSQPCSHMGKLPQRGREAVYNHTEPTPVCFCDKLGDRSPKSVGGFEMPGPGTNSQSGVGRKTPGPGS